MAYPEIKTSYTNAERLRIFNDTQFLPPDAPIALRIRYIFNGYKEIQLCESGNPLLEYRKNETDIWKRCSDKSCEPCKKLKSDAYSKAIRKSYETEARKNNHAAAVERMKTNGDFSRAGKSAWKNKTKLERSASVSEISKAWHSVEANKEKFLASVTSDEYRKNHSIAIKNAIANNPKAWASGGEKRSLVYNERIDAIHLALKTADDCIIPKIVELKPENGSIVGLYFRMKQKYNLTFEIKTFCRYIAGFNYDFGFKKYSQSSLETLVYDMINDDDSQLNARPAWLNGLELDVYSEKYNLAIEINGVYWHSSDSKTHPRHSVNKHKIKHDECQKRGIRLLQFTDYEINEKRDIVESIISAAIGNTQNRYMARKLKIAVISKEMAYAFFEQNHIKGASYKIGKNICVALLDGTDIVSCMHFNIHQNKAEIERYANKINSVVPGAASRLFKKFLKDNSYIKEVVSFSYNDYFTGDVYRKLGFKFASWSDGYSWTENAYLLEHRSKYMKHKLLSRFDWATKDMTEDDICYAAGFRKYHNAGYKKWIYIVNNE